METTVKTHGEAMKKKENIMSSKEIPYKIYLTESEMPESWYNVRSAM